MYTLAPRDARYAHCLHVRNYHRVGNLCLRACAFTRKHLNMYIGHVHVYMNTDSVSKDDP